MLPFFVRRPMDYTKTYKVRSMFTNENGIITLRSLTGLMVDLAFSQAREIEKDLAEMDDKTWLLYSWDIEIIKQIREGFDIEITTIPTHMKRFYAYRNFLVKKDGEIFAKAKATFILFDKEKQRAGIIDSKVLEAYGQSAETYSGRAYKKPDVYEKVKEIAIRRADYDGNHHVNNGVYFDYIKEISGLDEGRISHVKMIYKNQIRSEQKVGLFYKESEKQVDFKIGSEIDHAYGMVDYV